MARIIYGMHQPLHTTSAAHRTCASRQGWRCGRFGGSRAITIGAAEIRWLKFTGSDSKAQIHCQNFAARASLAADKPQHQPPDHGQNQWLAISKKDGRQRYAKASEPHSKGSIRIAHHQPNHSTSRTTSATHRQPHTGSHPQPATPGTVAIASNVVVMLPTNSSSSSVAVISSPTRSWISG